MKEELKRAKHLLNDTQKKCEKLQKTSLEKNKTIDQLRRQLAFFEARFYARLGVKRSNSFGEGNPSNDIGPAYFEQPNEDFEAGEDERMINVSMLDQSVVMDVSRVNKQSVLKRKRNNKGSIHFSSAKDTLMLKKPTPSKAAGQAFKMQVLEDAPRQTLVASVQDLADFEELDEREAFKVEEAKAYLTQLAKELMMDLNSKAKFTFLRMKNQKFIDFGILPTPVIKIDRSVSCPNLTFNRTRNLNKTVLADATLILGGGLFPGGNPADDYSIDCDFDELKRLIMKQQ